MPDNQAEDSTTKEGSTSDEHKDSIEEGKEVDKTKQEGGETISTEQDVDEGVDLQGECIHILVTILQFL